MTQQLKKFWRDEEAPTAVEYGIMVAGIAVAVVATVFALGGNINNLFNRVSGELSK